MSWIFFLSFLQTALCLPAFAWSSLKLSRHFVVFFLFFDAGSFPNLGEKWKGTYRSPQFRLQFLYLFLRVLALSFLFVRLFLSKIVIDLLFLGEEFDPLSGRVCIVLAYSLIACAFFFRSRPSLIFCRLERGIRCNVWRGRLFFIPEWGKSSGQISKNFITGKSKNRSGLLPIDPGTTSCQVLGREYI